MPFQMFRTLPCGIEHVAEVQKLTTKLQKLWDKCGRAFDDLKGGFSRYQKAQQEMVDIQHFNQQEREAGRRPSGLG